MNKSKWFTIFWRDGSKSFVFGPTIEDACNHAGIGNGALRAVDWYDEGVKNTHYYNKAKHEWTKFKDVELKPSEFLELSFEEIIILMKAYNRIIVKFVNNDIVMFKQDWSLFLLNGESCWTEYIELSFGEYFKGTYSGDSDDEENSFHYMMANGQYFAPENIPHAVEAFKRRVTHSPFDVVNSQYCECLEDIHAKQKIAYKE